MWEIYYSIGIIIQVALVIGAGIWALYWVFIPPIKGLIVWLLRVTLKVWNGKDLR